MAWSIVVKSPVATAEKIRTVEHSEGEWSFRVSEWTDGRYTLSVDKFPSGISLFETVTVADIEAAKLAAVEMRETWLAGLAARAELRAMNTDAIRVTAIES